MSVDEDITVGKLYADTKLMLLRFYLTTKKKSNFSLHMQQDTDATLRTEDNSSTTMPAESTGNTDVIDIESNTGPEMFLYSTEINSSNIDENALDDSNTITFLNGDIFNVENQ
ncbi:hypothetical protein ABG768_028094, partial [Culter alburnus]